MTLAIAKKRAAAGAQLLDEKLPGWVLGIDLDKLDLASGCSCVLGQLATDIVPRRKWYKLWRESGNLPAYAAATAHLRLSERHTLAFGFRSGAGASYDDLNTAWEAFIRLRQAKPSRNPEIVPKQKVKTNAS